MEKGSAGISLQDPAVRANESIIHEGIKVLYNAILETYQIPISRKESFKFG